MISSRVRTGSPPLLARATCYSWVGALAEVQDNENDGDMCFALIRLGLAALASSSRNPTGEPLAFCAMDDHLKEIVGRYERRRTRIVEVISGLSRPEAKLFSYGGTDPDCPYFRKEPEKDDSFSIALAYAQSRIVWDIEYLEALIHRHTDKGIEEA